MPPPKRQRKSKVCRRLPESAGPASFVRAVVQTGIYCDGQGLYPEAPAPDSRSLIQRALVHIRRCEFGLDGFSLISLKEVRAQAIVNR